MPSVSSAGSSSTEQLQSFEPEPTCSTGAGEPPAENAPAPAQAKAPEAKDEVVEHHEEHGALAKLKEWGHEGSEWLEKRGWEFEKGGDHGIGTSGEKAAYMDDATDSHHKDTMKSDREIAKRGIVKEWHNQDTKPETLAKGEHGQLTGQKSASDAKLFLGYTQKEDGSKQVGADVNGQWSAYQVKGNYQRDLNLADENGGIRDMKANGTVHFGQAEARAEAGIKKTGDEYSAGAGFRLGLNAVSAEGKANFGIRLGDEDLGRVGVQGAGRVGMGMELEGEAELGQGRAKGEWKFGAGAGVGGMVGMTADLDLKATGRALLKEYDQGPTHLVSELGAGLGHVGGQKLADEAGDLEGRAAQAEAQGSSVKAGLLHAASKAASLSGRAANAFGDMHAVIRDATAKDESWVNRLPGIGKSAPADSESSKPDKKSTDGQQKKSVEGPKDP